MVSFHVLSMPEVQVGSLIWELTSQPCSRNQKTAWPKNRKDTCLIILQNHLEIKVISDSTESQLYETGKILCKIPVERNKNIPARKNSVCSLHLNQVK